MQEQEVILKKYFGYNKFRLGQKELIEQLLAGRSVVAVMPTGAGKSLCYQIPALMLEGLTLVISPLVSLMKDQVRSLTEKGIKAVYFSSNMSRQEYGEAVYAVRNKQCKILYIAPERLENQRFNIFIGEQKLALVVIDEAHCLIRWGESFRPAYNYIRLFLDGLPQRPLVAAFTATATPEVKRGIIEELKIEQPFDIVTGFDRPNLYFRVEHPVVKQHFLRAWVVEQQGCGIVYCSTRRQTEEIYRYLKAWGYSACRYHAGLTAEERLLNQNIFINNKVQFMVATNAFGMGIDKADVRFILHYSMPLDIEGYYQEAGRAGRDGLPGECTLLFDKRDVLKMRHLLEYGCAQRDDSCQEKELWLEQAFIRLRQMENYCLTKGCLRQYLLNYFGQESSNKCDNCSNCQCIRKSWNQWS